MTTVRTRFAPSPTGYMHIGGMRTALFCWLWARHTGGTFLLRIDDTDQQRNMDEALSPILRAFQWLGLNWDEGPSPDGGEDIGEHGPYFQSKRGDLYQAAAAKLLAEGKAYRDFDTPEQIKADRDAAEQEKRNYLNIRRSLELTVAEVDQYLEEGRPHVVRFLVPRDRKVAIDDLVRGHVEWDCGLINDPVIVRGDGSPLYNFATVVDDGLMQITHVIRAEEHLTNTAVQVLIHEALGNLLPAFAHIPYVAAPGSKEKLSKRKLDKYRNNPQFRPLFEKGDKTFPRLGLSGRQGLDPVMVEYYERIGFLPQGVLNALVRLGWSLDDKTEFFSREEMIRDFTLDRVVKNAAGLDPDKLLMFQSHWMNQLPLEGKVAGCLPFLQRAGVVSAEPSDEMLSLLSRLVGTLGDRIKLFSDILDYEEYFLADDAFPYDEKAFEKRFGDPQAKIFLSQFADALPGLELFDAATLEALLHRVVEQGGAKVAALIHPLRLAVTGKSTGPGLYECLVLLGRDRCVRRIARTLART